jgi:hypothetical protein
LQKTNSTWPWDPQISLTDTILHFFEIKTLIKNKNIIVEVRKNVKKKNTPFTNTIKIPF